MSDADRLRCLRVALRATGAVVVFGIHPLTVRWPAGWSRHTGGRSEYLEMILAIYATPEAFLVVAARNPARHLSLISFAIGSGVVQGGVMAVQAVAESRHLHHLGGDVPALFAVAAVLAFLGPAALRPGPGGDAA